MIKFGKINTFGLIKAISGPTKNQRLVIISGDYHVKYSLGTLGATMSPSR